MKTARARAAVVALVSSLVLATVAGGFASVMAGTSTEPSDVVLVFDVSDSILLSDDGTNTEFADALDGVADRIEVVAADLATGNAEISFVVFGRAAVAYPANCSRLDLHDDPAAIARFEVCLRSIASEYRRGANAPIRQRIITGDTDHVAALTTAADLLPATSTRSAIVFFTDGEHDPPGTARDNENVVARIKPAFVGITPLAILPVGLGSRAGAFETELRAIYDAYFRDMEPCEGRATFSWPQVVFPSADAAGTAVALALQEVTCSFTVAPTPSPSSTTVPTEPPPTLGAPTGLRVLPGDRTVTVQWVAPTVGSEAITGYLVRCSPATGGTPIEVHVATATELQTKIAGLDPGASFKCEVAAVAGSTTGPFSPMSPNAIVLGVPEAPSQPRAEPLDGSARLSVDAAKSGAPVEEILIECTNPAGQVVRGEGPPPAVVVRGLTNGESITCIAFAQNQIGRSPASPRSAAFTPCSGLLNCNPWITWALAGVVLAALLGGGAFAARQYALRNRAWISAQVDGGENRPLGWGPELGVRMEQDDRGWYASPIPGEGGDIRVHYAGDNRFLVIAGRRTANVHQGDPTPIRAPDGSTHQLILRRYRERPAEFAPAKVVPAAPDAEKAAGAVAARIEGREED